MLPPHESIEFGTLLEEIIKELQKDEAINLTLLKVVCSTLTIRDNPFFSDEKLKEIQACNNVRTLLKINLRHCYRWDDFSFLTNLMSSIHSEKCIDLLKLFRVKVHSRIKLQEIYGQGQQKGRSFTEEYHKMVAIVNKRFLEITKEELDKLKYFISDQCSVEHYIISPFIKDSSSLFVSKFINTSI